MSEGRVWVAPTRPSRSLTCSSLEEREDVTREQRNAENSHSRRKEDEDIVTAERISDSTEVEAGKIQHNTTG